MNTPETIDDQGRCRAVIENLTPQIDDGLHAIKRTVGERVVVEADIFADGHVQLSAVVKYRAAKAADWSEAAMQPQENDRWRGEFLATEVGSHFYTIEAWVDRFKSWRQDLRKRIKAGQDTSLDLRTGAALVREAAEGAPEPDAARLRAWADELVGSNGKERALDEELARLMSRHLKRAFSTTRLPGLPLVVDPPLARFSAWYEMFPRSSAPEPGTHGTLRDCEEQLDRISRMGFDVLYLPPIHPIGRDFRKGRNNRAAGEPGDPGSPWAIGSSEGGHKAVHPQLGTLEDFGRLVRSAHGLGIEIALDIAFQCAPDHPYVREHPEWFRKRPDGTIQYAENPPKKYEDIVPFDFECDDWQGLWRELKSVFDFWIEQGVRIFRVDNPHTKSFRFWEWCIRELKEEHPELILLAEAFTRPAVMYHLAKLGFTQSYNYFPWRNRKDELTDYCTNLNHSPVREIFRPNFWPNTPDILTEYLQTGGRPAFMVRLVLAATLGASYGIYGPAFELCENTPREQGGEEYLNSEKYEVRHWDLKAPQSLEGLIARINRIRRENPALQSNDFLTFHTTDNDQLMAYTKSAEDGSGTVLTVVNLDPHHTQRGWLELAALPPHLDTIRPFQVHDLLTGARYLWKTGRNFVELNPDYAPAHIFRIRQHVRTERDFDYFM
jgi:starch synthase (maltosyl-transferring)